MTRLPRSFRSTEEGSLFRTLGEFNLDVAQTDFEHDVISTLISRLAETGGSIPSGMWDGLLTQLGVEPASDIGQMIRALTELHAASQPLDQVQAMVIRPGMGETQRWEQACRIYQPDRQLLLVMGAWSGEKTWRPTAEVLTDYGIDPTSPSVHFQPVARNTKDQSNWFVGKLRELGVMTAAVSVSKYHQPRSFATDLAGLTDNGMDGTVAMFPFPTSDSPQSIIPETGLAMGDSYEGELQRIKTYRNSGHVAHWKELANYLTTTVRHHASAV